MRLWTLGDFCLVFLGLPSFLIIGNTLIFVAMRQRAVERLEQWAAAQHFAMIEFHYRYFAHPWWHWGARAAFFKVKLRDKDGKERCGWLRLGSYFRGLKSDESEVIRIDRRTY